MFGTIHFQERVWVEISHLSLFGSLDGERDLLNLVAPYHFIDSLQFEKKEEVKNDQFLFSSLTP